LVKLQRNYTGFPCVRLIMTPKYIDIHSHVNFKAFDEDRDVVIKSALYNDTWVINVGTQADTSRKAIELAHKYDQGVYAIVGLHPIHTSASLDCIHFPT